MDTKSRIIKRVMLIGAGVGIAFYALYGFMFGLLIGGTAGLVISNEIFGSGVIEIEGGNLATRIILGGSMVSGAVISLLVFVVAGAVLGASLGYVLSLSVRETKETGIDAAKP